MQCRTVGGLSQCRKNISMLPGGPFHSHLCCPLSIVLSMQMSLHVIVRMPARGPGCGSSILVFLTCTKLVLKVQQIPDIVVQVALRNCSYDDKIVHIVPIIYMSAFNEHQFKVNHAVSRF